MTLKKQNQPKPKNIFTIIFVSLCKEKGKGHLGETPFDEMEPTDTISIIFVARRIINDDSLSLYIGIQQATLSF
jgi:hypothetical protein